MLLTRTTSHNHDPEKFPLVQLSLLALVRLAEPIALTSIFPYAWKLVLTFNVGNESNASFYAGLLISAFALAESITGMFWGGLSDKLGRRPVLFIGCMGTIASLLIVGFSTNFWLALFGRLLGGALNGNIGVIQTMVSELVVNPKHEPKAYAVMPFVWTVGTIIGPSIGGYFAEPAKNFPRTVVDNAVFRYFPYLLPNLICAGLMLVSVILGALLLQETAPRELTNTSTDDSESQRLLYDHAAAPPSDSLVADVEMAQDGYGTFAVPDDGATSDSDSECSQRWPGVATSSKVFTKRVIMLTVALGIFTYHSMTYDHLLPIFLQDRRFTNDQVQTALSKFQPGPLGGGLGMTTQQTGVVMSINGLIALFIQAVVFPVMASWLGIWKTLVVVTIAHPLAYLIMPGLALLPAHLVYPGLYACLTLRNTLSILAYPLLLILIKEASPSRTCLGKINGLAASTGAACRTIASPVAGALYGLGMNAGFTAIAWWASALVAAIGAVQLLTISNMNGDDVCEFVAENRLAYTENSRSTKKPSVMTICEIDSGYNTGDELTDSPTRTLRLEHRTFES